MTAIFERRAISIFRRITIGLFLIFSPLPRVYSAATNTIEALREAMAPPPAVWGRVSVGRSTLSPADPRAAAVGARFSQALSPKLAGRSQPPALTAHAAQQTAIQLLRNRAGQDVEVQLRPGNQTAMQIRGRILEPAATGVTKATEAQGAERTARNFLRAHGAVLRLDDPDRELRLESQDRDELGARHLKFSQTYQAITLWPAGLTVHLDAAGNVYLIDGAYIPTPSGVNTTPSIPEEEAIQQARSSVFGGANGQTKNVSLIIYSPLADQPRLAWKLTLNVDFMHSWVITVDAHDGRVLNRMNQCFDAGATGSANDLGGTSRNLNFWSADGKFLLADTTKQMFGAAFDPIREPHGVITIFDAREVAQKDLKTVYIVESTDRNTWLPDAVSALFNFGLTYDYFLERLERNSLDGKAGNIQAVVRVAGMDNAFWSGDLKMMFFGNVRPYPLALDVVGHELAHGVTQNSADLIYELQPGAMNEAMSDIFGTLVESRFTGRNDWTMGESLGKIFRDMKNPGALQIEGLNRGYPSKMSEFVDLPNSNDGDHGGVHINSSIINHAFYLLAEGLGGGIGLIDAEKIFYRCLTQSLQKQSQFIDARLGCIAAAEALFGAGSTQARKVAEAFDAVEIIARPATPDPSPIPAVQGPDSTLLISFDIFNQEIALGRRETSFGDPIDGVALVESVKEARPAVAGDGSFALFVDSANDLCAVSTADPNSLTCLGFQGLVHSVAISPDGFLAAFVLRDPLTGNADNKINVYDLAKNTTRTFELLAPVVDGSPVDSVLYADSMVFTSDGKQLIYDALSEIRFGGGAQVQRWSIFRINLATETTTVLVPPIEGADFGNPNLGRAGNRYLTFDAHDTRTRTTSVINLDLFTGDFAEVASVGQGLGFPCFTGDESAVVYAAPDPNAQVTGFSLFKQALGPTRLTKNGQPTLWLPDATIGVIYRRGTFSTSNALPVVTLTEPANNASFTAPATITLAANASDPDGSIASVEFYAGSTQIGESTAAPYRFTWSNVPAGNYRLTARATDNLGGSTDAAPVNVTVGQTGGGSIKLGAAISGNGALRLTITAGAGNYTVEQSTDLRGWTFFMPVTVGAGGAATVDDTRGTAGRQVFYRARRN